MPINFWPAQRIGSAQNFRLHGLPCRYKNSHLFSAHASIHLKLRNNKLPGCTPIQKTGKTKTFLTPPTSLWFTDTKKAGSKFPCLLFLVQQDTFISLFWPVPLLSPLTKLMLRLPLFAWNRAQTRPLRGNVFTTSNPVASGGAGAVMAWPA